jgi:hyperosmotically inducible periplasmic protein
MNLKFVRTALLCCAISGTFVAAAQDRPAPDNTKVNRRDRSKAEPTADQAKNNKTDLSLMQQIRKAVIDDSTLSTNAHNVKIIAQNGKVTLKGPVNSEMEKQNIEKKATEIAGAGNVTNEISVKAVKEKKTTTSNQ